ncbi:MAG: formylglycine-generating enzyme family protein [Fibrobacteres bacterium]|nr:formylglycine-generating enzyme family protein [Fibrobacterota bacterium]
MKFLVLTVLFIAFCFLNCQDRNITKVEVLTHLQLTIKWMQDSTVIIPKDVDSVRITIHSSGMESDRVNIFSYADKSVKLDELPGGLDFSIKVEGINKVLGVLYLGNTAVPGETNQNISVTVNAYALQKPDTSSPVITVLSHNMYDTLATRSLHLFGKVVDFSGISSLKVNDSTIPVVDNFFDLPGLILKDGRNNFIIRAVDSSPKANVKQITFVVYFNPVYIPVANHSPYFLLNAASMNATVKVGQSYQRTLRAADQDEGNRLTFSPWSEFLLLNDSIISWTPEIADTGIRHAWALVFDQDSAKDSLAWVLTVVDSARNTAPLFITKAAEMTRYVTVGEEYRDTVYASDLEQESGLIYRLLNPPTGITVDSIAGIISWRPVSTQVGSHAVTMQVRDDSGATAILSWPITVRYPSITQFSAGRDTTRSINDSLRLHPTIVLTSGSIIKYEWDIGKTGNFIATSSGDTNIILPSIPTSSYICVLRITNSNNDQLIDEMVVRFLRDPPRANAGLDSIVMPGATVKLHAVTSDLYGRVVLTEWDIGASGNFITCTVTDTLIQIPLQDSSYSCILKATDDDGNVTLDTVVYRTLRTAMRACPSDTFQMGSTSAYPDEVPDHEVRVNPFYMDSTEVTQGRFFEIMGVKPSNSAYNPDYPVESVTWFDAVLFCNALSKRYGYDTIYSYSALEGTAGNNCTALNNLIIDTSKTGYRLPTEAEWESACRAGGQTAYYWSDDSTQSANYAVYGGGAAASQKAVATKMPNGNRLYDMAGNVWEWCNDWYGNYTAAVQNNPVGPVTGSARVIRGGGWQDKVTELRSSNRGFGIPGWKSSFVGFRTVLPAR